MIAKFSKRPGTSAGASTFKKIRVLAYAAYAFVAAASFAPLAHAAPFGQGAFGANIPFGAATSIAVNLGGNVTLNLAAAGQNYSATGSHTVTVTSNDPVGYSLYAAAAGGNAMTGPNGTIPASGNSSAAALAANTWGYNTDGSSNYLGMPTSPVLIKTLNSQAKNGDGTTVTYGVLTDITKPAGSYTVSVTYTVVALNQ